MKVRDRRDRDQILEFRRDRDGTGTKLYGTGTGPGLNCAGPGWDRDQIKVEPEKKISLCPSFPLVRIDQVSKEQMFRNYNAHKSEKVGSKVKIYRAKIKLYGTGTGLGPIVMGPGWDRYRTSRDRD